MESRPIVTKIPTSNSPIVLERDPEMKPRLSESRLGIEVSLVRPTRRQSVTLLDLVSSVYYGTIGEEAKPSFAFVH